MNKKDCETLGYLLAGLELPEEQLEHFFWLDERIRAEYETFRRGHALRDQAMARYSELMAERFGPHWATSRACSEQPDVKAELWVQAKQEASAKDDEDD